MEKVCECKKLLEGLNKEEIAEATKEAMKTMSFSIDNYPLITKIAIGGMIGFGVTTAISLYQLKKIKDLEKKMKPQNSGMFDVDINDLLFTNYCCDNCEGGCAYDEGKDCRHSFREGYRKRRYTQKVCSGCGKNYVAHSSMINQDLCNACMKEEAKNE